MTLREYILFWQETYDKHQSRPTTYAAHNYVFKNHILPGLGDIPLSELTSEMVGEFLEERKRFGNHRTGSSGLGEETMRHIHRLLQQCLDQAIRDGLLTENPVKAFRYRKSTTVKANIMTPLEMEDYLDAAEWLGYLPMFMLALTTGLRQGELIALKWSDLDIESRTLTIAEKRAVVRRELVEYGSQTRSIRLTPEVVDLLIMEHSKHPSSPLMFMHPATLKPYSPQMVRRMHKEIIREAGIDHIRFTDLRHTCAILALKNGMDAKELAHMLELAAQLGTVKGKKSYGYLPKRLKKLVDEIVDEMERLPGVSKCYDQWLLLQGKVDAYYHDKPQKRIPLSQQKEFRQIKNAVIQEAERLHMGEITFEEKGLNQQDEPEEFQNASYDYWALRDIIWDESLTMEVRSDAVSEMDKLAESGDRYAQYLMGKLWRDGPLLIPNSANAQYWFERAAEQGHIASQYSLAKLYLADDVEVRNTRTGMNWLCTAAVNGSSYAMYHLAKECLKGEHIKMNTASAVEWFARSAEGGNPYAQYMLGKLYLTGKEAPYDEERAVHWLTRSAEQNNQYAQYLLNHLEENRLPSAMLVVTRLLHHMSRVFRDNSVPKSRPGGVQIDRKRLKKLQEKRIALGHKPDDHEQQWPDMTM